MSDDTDGDEDDRGGEPEVPVVCSACETTSRVPLSAVADTIERHNDRLHDGESIAEVDPALADQLANIVAEELGLLDGE